MRHDRNRFIILYRGKQCCNCVKSEKPKKTQGQRFSNNTKLSTGSWEKTQGVATLEEVRRISAGSQV